MKGSVETIVCIAAFSLLMILGASARTFDFKVLGTKGSSVGGAYWFSDAEKKKSAFFQVKVGSAGKLDDKSKMEIRAATIFKNAQDKRTGVNDVATFSFAPVNDLKPLYFVVATGSALSRTDRYWVGSRSSGWQIAGVIIEIWQSGKVVKHWTNVPGNGGKSKLTENVEQLRVFTDGHDQKWHGSYSEFDNATEIISVNQKGEKVDIEELLKECSEPESEDKADAPSARQEKERDGVVAEKAAEDDIAEGEFVMKSLCGFEFGSQRPAFSMRSNSREITLKKPFRNYTRARLDYGANSGQLLAVHLYSNQRFASDVERTEAAAAAAAVFEKKYGIAMEDCGSCFRFSDARHDIWIYATNIDVRRRDMQEKDEMLRNAIREATKRQIKSGENSDDGSDVL